MEAPGHSLWDIAPPSPAFAEELHGFTWLDDLCAVGDARARATATEWVMGWIETHGDGKGPGWTPQLTARRLIRLINHAVSILRGQDGEVSEAFFRSLGQQTIFVSRTWSLTDPGLPRIEAVTGAIYAGMALLGMEREVGPAVEALNTEARAIAAEGTIPSRNPEELMEILNLLNWAVLAIEAADRVVPEGVRHAVRAMVPVLRALRHADGSLARFHGGGRGIEGRLDQALAESGIKTRPRRQDVSMGYAHISAGRSTLIVDAARPPSGTAATTAHASTLAFELTSGRRPVVVNCGAGGHFGPDWRRAGRATPSHSTLGIDGWSSARTMPSTNGGDDRLVEAPQNVQSALSLLEDGSRIELSHDGYRGRFGLIHGRTLDLGVAGRALVGEDYLVALNDADRDQFDRAMDANALQGIPFTVRFHLHPDTEAEVDLGGKAVSIALKSGEIWVLRHESICDLDIKPSVYLETGRLRPRAAQQVVLTGRAMSYATQIRWSLAKAQETPDALRDLQTVDAEETPEPETAAHD